MEEKLLALKTKLKDITNLHNAAAVLSWDQETYMPPGGAPARAEQLATLNRFAHELFTTDEIGELLSDLEQVGFEYDSDDASLLRVARREYDKARKLPSKLVEDMSRTFSLGQQVWTEARKEKKFARFQDILAKIIDLNIQAAEAYGYEDHIYDALLDLYEPEMKTADVNAVFEVLKAELIPLVQAIVENLDAVDDSVLHRTYDEAAQWDFGLIPLRAIGYDFDRGRQDKSAHPFTTSFSVNDVRITTRVHKNFLPSALFGTLHEGGHALYEQGSEANLEGTLLAGGTSLGVHESQSRLWENVVGRSRPFWQYYYPRLQEFFPKQLVRVDLDQFYRAINRVRPSFIRVEADEVTYNLHIFLRFELEQALITQQLRVADLPEAWNAKMEHYLGLTPLDDAQGVLQDIHWSGGMVGYFPTYTLGNVLSLQFFNQTVKEIPDLPEQFERGEFDSLLSWFRSKIHRYGRKYTAAELIQRVTGDETIRAEPYIQYVKQKYSEIYGL